MNKETCTWISSQKFSTLRSRFSLLDAAGRSGIASLNTLVDEVLVGITLTTTFIPNIRCSEILVVSLSFLDRFKNKTRCGPFLYCCVLHRDSRALVPFGNFFGSPKIMRMKVYFTKYLFATYRSL